MLHAARLELPDGRAFEAKVPALFARVLEGRGDELGSADEQRDALADAACLREPLVDRASAFRLVNDAADLMPGVTIDRYGEFAVLAVSSPAAEAASETPRRAPRRGRREGRVLEAPDASGSPQAGSHDARARQRVSWRGGLERLEVHGREMKLWVELGAGLGTGLFIDQRDGRARVRSLASGAKVLNLFSYTSSFSVAAALGGRRAS